MGKIRVNITVDKDALEKAKTKLRLFGGKLSTLFDVYLKDFVESMDREPYESAKEKSLKIKELEERIARLERKGK